MNDSVQSHYDGFAYEYLTTYGTVIQSARSCHIDELLKHEFESANIQPGMNVLDAGCGVAGPAMFFAEHERTIHVYGLTISPMQHRLAEEFITESRVENVTIQCGDYHELSEIYPPNVFDRVLFLESLCHAKDRRRTVLEEASKVLRPKTGCLYIKDYFRIDFRDEKEKHDIQERYYERMERDYHVRFTYVSDLLTLLETIGFHVEFVRKVPNHLVTDNETAIEFERAANLTWREGLPFATSESMELLARKKS